MRSLSCKMVVIAAGMLSFGCTRGPKLETTLASRPRPAQLSLNGRGLGQTPTVITVASMAELLQITAAVGQEKPTETRVRMLSESSAEVTFYFGENSSSLAKTLGFPRILVFDYGSAFPFEVDRYDLASSLIGMLNRQAELLNDHFSGIPVFVCGHTDQTGEANHNSLLSLQRAQAVADHLEHKGVPKKLITAQGFGSSYPLAGNDTVAGRALNRRTEIILPQ